jgi:hypothetical protein
MQTINIKSGTSAKFTITPKINGVEVTGEQMAGVTIYVFFIYQFTNKIYGEPYKLTDGNLSITLTPNTTIAMLGNAEENQKFEVQFAIKTNNGDIIADDEKTDLVVNITRWVAGKWLNQESEN